MDASGPSLAEKLRQHQLRTVPPMNTEGWIFANPATGKPYWPGRHQENWLVPAAERGDEAGSAGIRFTVLTPETKVGKIDVGLPSYSRILVFAIRGCRAF